jgi:hypothetical protein
LATERSLTPLPIVEREAQPPRPLEFLLLRGNDKLGEDVYHFSLPALDTCPGRSRACEESCYALAIYGRWRTVLARHQGTRAALENLDEFRERMVAEIRCRPVRVLRWHVAGDVFSVGYARALLGIMQATPRVEHFLYTRSWRVARLRRWLAQIAALPNVAMWYSLDATTGAPSCVPPGVRLAWMATCLDEEDRFAARIARCDLVFMDHPLRRERLRSFGGVRVCPQENDNRVTCTNCRFCLPRRAD